MSKVWAWVNVLVLRRIRPGNEISDREAKKWGGRGPPGPPGSDAYELVGYSWLKFVQEKKDNKNRSNPTTYKHM